MAGMLNITITWATRGTAGGRDGVDDLSLADLADGLAGAEYTAAGLLEEYAQGQKVRVELKRDGESAALELFGA